MLEAEGVPQTTGQEEARCQLGTTRPRGRHYRVKRDFDGIDRGEFREAAFGVIRDYFERAIAEIDAIADLRGRFVSHSATSFRCTIVNRTRAHGTAYLTVHGHSEIMGFGDISYSLAENARPNTANGMFMIEADEYEFYLRSMLGFQLSDQERLTPEAAGKQLWKEFLQQAGVTSD